jgi:hypothetical protein
MLSPMRTVVNDIAPLEAPILVIPGRAVRRADQPDDRPHDLPFEAFGQNVLAGTPERCAILGLDRAGCGVAG